ncbi:MAG: D-aminoacyl-tRNA deacylase [Phycisphaerae bacterium]|nr:D-aminoacyl-tRNA deacylase [Phycisphaerae bacterium]
MKIVDSHCHLTHEKIAVQLDDVLARARSAGVGAFLTVGCGPEDAARAVALAAGHDDVWAAVGIHPHDAETFSPDAMSRITPLLEHDRVVAVGEIGLDYHYDFSPRVAQQEAFAAQLEVAARADLPVIIHCREAIPDALATIARCRADGLAVRGVFHCFTGTAAEIVQVVAAGFHVSLAGMVTFKKSDELRDAARLIPVDQLLLETDCPYLSPEPVRKVKVNEPAHLLHTFRFLADLLGASEQELAERTNANAQSLFGIG